MTASRRERLANIVRYIRGITFKPADKIDPSDQDAITCMRTKNIQKTLDESDRIAVPPRFVKRKEQYLRAGDILVSSANSWNLVGKCVRVPESNYPATAGGFISIVRPLVDEVDGDYLYRWLSSPRTQCQVRSCARQTTNIANLAVDRFLALEIPLPPLPEQRRIAAILDKSDAIRRKRAEALRLTDDFLRSAFLDMFGDPVTNPKGWPKAELGQLLTTIIDYRGKTPPKSSAGIPLISAANVKGGCIDLSRPQFISSEDYERWRTRGMAQAGDVLITTEAPVGEVAPYPRKGLHQISRRVMALRPNPEQIRTEYLLHVMLSRNWQARLRAVTRGSTVPRVLKPDITTQPIPCPPVTEQDRFVTLAQLNAHFASCREHASTHMDALFHSLVQRAFRGEL